MNFETITKSKKSGVSTITLNRPDRLNALTELMQKELSLAIGEVDKDEEVRVLVITGAGRGFCSGADLEHPLFSMPSLIEARKGVNLFNEIILKLRALPKPVIASVNGIAAGGGANLALACDMIIASEQARFGQVFVNIGVHVDGGGTHFLPWAVGVPKAMELMMTGDIIDAKEAWRIGMINKVVPPEGLEPVTMELAEKLASGPPAALGMIKKSVYRSLTEDLSAALEREADNQAILLSSEDSKEGIRAIREKRKPRFIGR